MMGTGEMIIIGRDFEVFVEVSIPNNRTTWIIVQKIGKIMASAFTSTYFYKLPLAEF